MSARNCAQMSEALAQMRIDNLLLVLLLTCCIACDQGSVMDQGSNDESPIERDQSITAAFMVAHVESVALTKAQEAHLILVRSSSVRVDGTSSMWQYEYVGPLASTLWFRAGYNIVVYDSASSAGVGVAVITYHWIDSNIALRIAETHGGSDFRARNPDYSISASLVQPVVPNASTYWYVTYRSSNINDRVEITIDAANGKVDQDVTGLLPE